MEACCGKPSLVRETSRISIWGALLHPVHVRKSRLSNFFFSFSWFFLVPGCANSSDLFATQTVRKMFVNYEDSSQRIILRVSTRDI